MSDSHDHSPNLTDREVEHASSLVRSRPAVLYEVVRKEGEIELQRSFSALWWSGIAAGLAIGLSPLAAACMVAIFGDAPTASLLKPLGYTAGFVLVILARQQLFTENTITTVLPVMSEKSWSRFFKLARVWVIVLAANIVGAALFALFVSHGDFLSPEIHESLRQISLHAVTKSGLALFMGGILAGWLIAALVWVLPEAGGSEFLTVLFFTYLIGLTDASHIVAGTVEALVLLLTGDIGVGAAFGFAVPTLLGNIVGGTVLFALISYAQVHEEKKPN